MPSKGKKSVKKSAKRAEITRRKGGGHYVIRKKSSKKGAGDIDTWPKKKQ